MKRYVEIRKFIFKIQISSAVQKTKCLLLGVLGRFEYGTDIPVHLVLKKHFFKVNVLKK